MSDKHLGATDVGTRYDHLSDLLELWRTGLEVMKRYDRVREAEKREKNLASAIDLLEKHLNYVSGYDARMPALRDCIERIRK
jgi:hypothetical protein